MHANAVPACCGSQNMLGTGELFADQSSEIFHSTNELADIAHFVIVPANYANDLCIANSLNAGLSCIEQ